MSHPEPERRTNAPPGTSLLAGLTPEQAQAVTHGTGPLLLIAGTGAGKPPSPTRALSPLAVHLDEQARRNPRGSLLPGGQRMVLGEPDDQGQRPCRGSRDEPDIANPAPGACSSAAARSSFAARMIASTLRPVTSAAITS